jgi:hypothetical protein
MRKSIETIIKAFGVKETGVIEGEGLGICPGGGTVGVKSLGIVSGSGTGVIDTDPGF